MTIIGGRLRRVVLTAVVFVAMVGSVSAAAASGPIVATSVKVTRWEVDTGNFFGVPSHTVAPGKTFRHCAGLIPTGLGAWFTVRGSKHVPIQGIWKRNGRVYHAFRVDLSNPSGVPPPPPAPPGAAVVVVPEAPVFYEFLPFSPDGTWSLTIKEFGEVIGFSRVTLASKRC
jgi:hypothetical protein